MTAIFSVSDRDMVKNSVAIQLLSFVTSYMSHSQSHELVTCGRRRFSRGSSLSLTSVCSANQEPRRVERPRSWCNSLLPESSWDGLRSQQERPMSEPASCVLLTDNRQQAPPILDLLHAHVNKRRRRKTFSSITLPTDSELILRRVTSSVLRRSHLKYLAFFLQDSRVNLVLFNMLNVISSVENIPSKYETCCFLHSLQIEYEDEDLNCRTFRRSIQHLFALRKLKMLREFTKMLLRSCCKDFIIRVIVLLPPCLDLENCSTSCEFLRDIRTNFIRHLEARFPQTVRIVFHASSKSKDLSNAIDSFFTS